MSLSMSSKLVAITMIMGSALMASSASAAVDWSASVIRNSTNNIAPSVTEVGDNGVIFSTEYAGQKVNYGTNAFNGLTLGDIVSVNWTTLEATPSDKTPYLNIWVTDGTNRAILAVEGNYVGNVLAGFYIKAYEATDLNNLDWLLAGKLAEGEHITLNSSGNRITLNGVDITWGDLADVTIGLPTDGYISPSATTSTAFNIVYGDTRNNYIGTYELSNLQVAAVPEAASLGILALGASGLLAKRRRNA